MWSDDPAEDGEEAAPVIYPLVADDGNRRVLCEWLRDHETYVLADTDEPVTKATYDLCIVDQDGLHQHADALETVKASVRPALLPTLLLLSDITAGLIDVDYGQLADTVFETTVDELISMPIRQAELAWRIKALLRLRRQSVALRSQTIALRRFREAVEASGSPIWIADADGAIEYVNPAFESVTGYSFEEVEGEHGSILEASVGDHDRVTDIVSTVSSGTVWRDTVCNRRKDGEQYVADQTVAPIETDGAVTAMVAVQVDITEREDLRNRLRRHRDIVQRLDDPIMLQDRSGEFVLFNDALVEFAGISRSALLGADEFAFMDDETASVIEAKKRRVIQTESPTRYAVSPTFERSDKEAFFSTSRYPYYDENGDLVGTIAICRDVTSLKERTRQLRVMDNVLRHNIRNDMNVIQGQAERIHESVTGEMADAAAAIVSHAGDLLSTSQKSQAITAVLSEEPSWTQIDVAALVNYVARDTETSWPAAEVTVDASDAAVVTATDNLQQALEELVTNAVVHTDRDTPRIDLSVAPHRADETVEIVIADDGPGISELDRSVIESGAAIEALSHGSGLGLWLVYWIVHRSGGSIAVKDREPRGTQVRITLPLDTETTE